MRWNKTTQTETKRHGAQFIGGNDAVSDIEIQILLYQTIMRMKLTKDSFLCCQLFKHAHTHTHTYFD